MGHTFDNMLKEATALPWTMGARLMVELRSTVRIPEEPTMTKQAAAGMVKIARICKLAQTPEEAQAALQQAAMTDPNVVEAMDYQQAKNEREMLMAKVQELQMATEAAQAQAMQADQQVQAAMQQQEQLVAGAQQAKQEQVNAVMESMMAKDQALQTQVSSQQHRQEVANFAQQMADQLKQIAASSPEERAMQEQAAQEQAQQQQMQQAQVQQEQAAAQQAQTGQAPPKKKVQKEVKQADNAQQEAQEQTAEAQQSIQQDQTQQEQQAAMQQQAMAMGGQPKMGSARLQKVANAIHAARLQKAAAKSGEKTSQFSGTNEGYGESQGGSGQQGMFVQAAMGDPELSEKQQAYREARSALREGRAPVRESRRAGRPGFGPGRAERDAYRAERAVGRERRQREMAGLGPMAKGAQGFATSNSAAGMDQGGIGAQGGMNQYASMGGIGKGAGVKETLKGLKGAFRMGRLDRGERILTKAMGEPYERTSMKGLTAAQRAAHHLGEHGEKYLVGGALAGTAAGGYTLGRRHGGTKKTASARVIPLIEKLADEQKAREVGEALGVNWDQVDFTPKDFARGMEIEKEHHRPGVDIIPDEELDMMTGKITLAHLREGGDYYDRLEKMEAAMKVDKDHSSEAKEKVSFSKNRAAEIAQRVRLVKEGWKIRPEEAVKAVETAAAGPRNIWMKRVAGETKKLIKKGCRGSVEAEPRPTQIVKAAAAPAALVPPRASGALTGLGLKAGYAGLGAAIGGGVEAARMKAHEKKMGLDKPTKKEVELAGKLRSAKELLKQDPSYSNKVRISNIKYKMDMERLNREHPNRAALRGATVGAGAGLALGSAAHRLLSKIVKR